MTSIDSLLQVTSAIASIYFFTGGDGRLWPRLANEIQLSRERQEPYLSHSI